MLAKQQCAIAKMLGDLKSLPGYWLIHIPCRLHRPAAMRCCQPARSLKTQNINSQEVHVHQLNGHRAYEQLSQTTTVNSLCRQPKYRQAHQSKPAAHMLLSLLSYLCFAFSQYSGTLQAAMAPLTPPAVSCRCTWPSCRSSSARCWPSLQPSTSTSRRFGRQRRRDWRRRPCLTSGWWPWQQVGASWLAGCLRSAVSCALQIAGCLYSAAPRHA